MVSRLIPPPLSLTHTHIQKPESSTKPLFEPQISQTLMFFNIMQLPIHMRARWYKLADKCPTCVIKNLTPTKHRLQNKLINMRVYF